MPSLSAWASTQLQAKTGELFTAYRVPSTASPAGSIGSDIVLWHVRGEAMIFFVRPGWEDLRAMLMEKYWVGLATHANLDYAIEAARILARRTPQREEPRNDRHMHTFTHSEAMHTPNKGRETNTQNT